jgi:hypothetical protein
MDSKSHAIAATSRGPADPAGSPSKTITMLGSRRSIVITSSRTGTGSGLIQTLPCSRPKWLANNHRRNLKRSRFSLRGRSKVRSRHFPSQERLHASSGWRPPANAARPSSVRRGTHFSSCSLVVIRPFFFNRRRCSRCPWESATHWKIQFLPPVPAWEVLFFCLFYCTFSQSSGC